MSTTTPLMTTEEFLALPDDGIERDLIRGELRERDMTRRNRLHAATEARLAYSIRDWLEKNPDAPFDVLAGEAGSTLNRGPDTTVGIDVAVFSLDVLEQQSPDSSLVVGVPLLAVEILSLSDRHDAIHEKIIEYLRAGVPLVWLVDPDFQIVRVHRPDTEPVMFNRTQQITGEDVLPGFEASVADFFPNWKR